MTIQIGAINPRLINWIRYYDDSAYFYKIVI